MILPPPTNVTTDDNTNSNRDNYDHDDDTQPERCAHPDCNLPKHPDSVPHSHEQRDTRELGRSPRLANLPRMHYSHHACSFILEDVNHYLLSINPDEIVADIPTPNSYEQAIKSKLSYRWKESINKEITDLLKHDTWELVKRSDVPKSRRITKSKWVYKIKLNKDGTIERLSHALWYVDTLKLKVSTTFILSPQPCGSLAFVYSSL